MVDVKKNDALSLLKYLNSSSKASRKKASQSDEFNSTTCFLRELILFANTTPFAHKAAWLPQIEKDIQSLHHRAPLEYMLLAEVVSFTQKSAIFLSKDNPSIQLSALLDYIEANQLYNPDTDFIVYKNHPLLSGVYFLICQSICLQNLTTNTLNDYLPAINHYYALPQHITPHYQKLLRVILVLVFSINQQLEQTNLNISPKHLIHHFKQLKSWRNYNQAQLKNWLNNIPISRQIFTSFLQAYLKTSSVYLLSTIKTDYYQWIYDAYAIFFTTSKEKPDACVKSSANTDMLCTEEYSA